MKAIKLGSASDNSTSASSDRLAIYLFRGRYTSAIKYASMRSDYIPVSGSDRDSYDLLGETKIKEWESYRKDEPSDCYKIVHCDVRTR